MPYGLLMFLTNKNLLHAFVKNAISDCSCTFLAIVSEQEVPGSYILLGAFDWSDTPEGKKFWEEIYYEYLQNATRYFPKL